MATVKCPRGNPLFDQGDIVVLLRVAQAFPVCARFSTLDHCQFAGAFVDRLDDQTAVASGVDDGLQSPLSRSTP